MFVEKDRDSVLIRVVDTGPGVEEAELKGLFKSFQRGDAGRRDWTGGTGLGLYIAEQFVALHGGAIWAESAGKGKGSTFCIRLPLRRDKLAA